MHGKMLDQCLDPFGTYDFSYDKMEEMHFLYKFLNLIVTGSEFLLQNLFIIYMLDA